MGPLSQLGQAPGTAAMQLKNDELFITVLIFCEDCLSLKDFCSYLYLPWPHDGSTYSVVLAQLSEDLAWLGCISPCVVAFSARRKQRVKGNGRGFSLAKCVGESGLAMQRLASRSVAVTSAQPNFSFELRHLLCLLRPWGQTFKHRRSWGSLTYSSGKVAQALAWSPRGKDQSMFPVLPKGFKSTCSTSI